MLAYVARRLALANIVIASGAATLSASAYQRARRVRAEAPHELVTAR